MSKTGKLIVIESLGDNYGKTTIVKHLLENLPNTISMSFPDDNSNIGHAIRKHMSDKINKLVDMNSLTVAVMYLTEMSIVCQCKIRKLLDSGYNILLDRYYFSTILYETSIEIMQRENEGHETELDSDVICDYLGKLNMIIFDILKLIKPDVTIVLTDEYGVCERDIKLENELDNNTRLQTLTKEVGKFVLDNSTCKIDLGKVYTLNISSADCVRYTPEHNISKILDIINKES